MTPGPTTLLAVLRDSARATWTWCRDPRHRWAVAGIAFFLLANSAYSVHRAANLHACDLVQGYLRPARGMLFHGADPYVDFEYNSYPPFFYCVMAPLAPLPNAAASAVWTLIQLGLFFGSAAWLTALVRRTSERGARLAPAVLAPALCAFLLATNLHLGQSNLFSFFFVCGALYAMAIGHEKKAGVLLAVAVAYKITPALFFVYWAVKGRWKALWAGAAAMVVWLAAVPALVFGPTRAWSFLDGWVRHVLGPFFQGDRMPSSGVKWYHTNQSLDAFLQRHLTPYGAEAYGGLHAWLDPAFLDETQARWLGIALKVALLGVVTWIAWRGRRIAPARSALFETALVFLTILFVSPVAWISHFIVALAAYTVVLHELYSRPRSDPAWRWLRWPLTFAAFTTFINLTPQIQSYSTLFLGHAVLSAAMAGYTLRHVQRRREAPGDVVPTETGRADAA